MMHAIPPRWWAAVLGMMWCAGASLASEAASSTAIESFQPQGTVSGVEAVRVRFSDSIVAFGDPGAEAPFKLVCEGPVPEGEGRWLDDTRWVHSFNYTVPAGVRCVAEANPDFRDLKGRPLPAGVRYTFDTGAPAVMDFRPYPGMDIDEEQVFLLAFNAPVSADAVAAQSHCGVKGIGERIPVKAVSGADRDALMEAAYMPPTGEGTAVVLLQCARALPPESRVQLVVGPGIRALGQSPDLAGAGPARVLEYNVRAPFTAQLSCTRERAGRPCLPISPITLKFSAPVPVDSLAGMRLSSGDTIFEPEMDDDGSGFVSYVQYVGPFPPKTQLTLALSSALHDDAGRPLTNADRYPLTIELADYPPLAKFASGTFGVIERFAHARPGEGKEEAAVPVTIRHIEPEPTVRAQQWSAGKVTNLRTVDDAEVLAWYGRLQRLESSSRWSEAQLQDIVAGRAPSDDYASNVPRIDARSFSLLKSRQAIRQLTLPAPPAEGKRPFEVVGIPLQEPGFHVLEIESPLLGASLLDSNQPMYVRTGVLLTNLSLHVKQGQDDLLVWVTTLADARSVAGAEVNVLDCRGRLLAQGRTDAEGVWHHLASVDATQYCPETGLNGLFVSARIPADHPLAHGAADYAFVLSGWDRGIETWRFNVPTSSESQPELFTHTVFDRSLFRAGEKVSMKHYLREALRDGFGIPENRRPDRLVIEHEGSSQQHELTVEWLGTATGGLVALSEFNIPESAHLGSYSVRLTDKENNWYGSSRFRVEAFRLPTLTGKLVVRAAERPGVLVAPQRLDVDMQLSWLAGGAASGQRVALNAMVQDRFVRFDGYDDYSFAAPPRVAFNADTEAGVDQTAMPEASSPQRRLFLKEHDFTLDANGTATVPIDSIPQTDRPQRFDLEASYADPGGEIQTLSQSVDVWPSTIQAGIRAEGWDRANADIPVRMIALGLDGKPREGVAMRLIATERKTYTVRKRMVGGFYRYDSHTERKEIGALCEGKTDAAGMVLCTVRFDRAGAIELVAATVDDQGRESRAYTTVWVSGVDELWFGGQDDDRIDLIPARREWQAGEEAEFQVRMPFREAVALVSVEREGVLWKEQVALKGTNPVVKIPISPDWGPNVYVSALVLRGRLYQLPWQSFFKWGWREPAAWLEAYGANPDDSLVTQRIDLAKPAFRLGLTEIRVGGAADRLHVELVPDDDVFQVREAVSASVRVTLPDGRPAAHGAIAFAAVDEALLELAPNESWRLYEAMHPRRSLAVRTATTQLEVVGRRHYGRKAVAAGGGGGMTPTRRLFDTLLTWQPVVPLDENGEAVVRFRLNDALTRFRLVALADHGAGYFGSARAHVTSRQDLQLVPGLPPVVREGDEYQASVVVRNGTDQERTLKVRASYGYREQQESLPPRSLTLAAHGSGTVSWRISVPTLAWPDEMSEGSWRFEAGDGEIVDRVVVTQRIEAGLPATTVQAALLGLSAGASTALPVSAPKNALKDEAGNVFGGIALDAAASLLGSLEGVRAWWEAYPYTCLEQTASQAIALNDPARWKKVLSRLSTHMDDDGLLRYFPGTGPGSAALTAYVVTVSAEARAVGLQFALPEMALQRMLDGLQAFAEGRLKREVLLSDVELDAYRVMAMDALARHGRVSPAMLQSVNLSPNTWPTPVVVDWLSLLLKMPDASRRQQAVSELASLLVSRMSVSGTAMNFSDTPLNAAPGLMATSVTSLARLMLAVMDRPEWQADLPRMAQGMINAQRNGTWSITTENVLAMLALKRFAQRFEAVSASGTVQTQWTAAPAAALRLSGADDAETAGNNRASAQLAWPGAGDQMMLSHEGQGRAWISLRAQARVPLTQPEGSGYSIVRRVVPVLRQVEGQWSRGDVYRVELEIRARDASNWVVLSDPVPAGATILGSGLKRDSSAYQNEAVAIGEYPPAFVEREPTVYRAYFDYLPAGRIKVSYTVRLNAVGRFLLPPTRVEALYRPDLYGRFPNPDSLDVKPGPFDGAEP